MGKTAVHNAAPHPKAAVMPAPLGRRWGSRCGAEIAAETEVPKELATRRPISAGVAAWPAASRSPRPQPGVEGPEDGVGDRLGGHPPIMKAT